MNARIEYAGYGWQLTLPCGDKLAISGIDAKIPQICPKCKKIFGHVVVIRVPKEVAPEPRQIRC